MFTNAAFNSVAMKSGKAVAKSVAGMAALLTIATSTVGCNQDDADVIGTIAIVAGVVAIAGGGSSHDRDRDRDRDRDHGHGPGPGGPGWDDRGHGPGPGGPGGPGHGGPGGHHLAGSFTLAADSALALSTSTTANDVAFKFNIPLQSAERLTAVLQDGAAGNSAVLADMGLSKDELNRVARYSMPSDVALDQIASKLAMSREMSRSLVQQLMDETRVQMADVNSAAWTNCQSTGKWKTDANGGTCKSTGWAGCSPETGASICASVN